MNAAAIRSAGLALGQRHGQTLAGILDQGVVGVGNLAMGLIVLHGATKEQYGLYSLCYTTVLLLIGFVGSVFAAQMTAAYHDVAEAERGGFVGAMLRAQLAVTVPLGLAAAAGLALLPATVTDAETRHLLAITALACPGAMACDFLRSHRFLLRRAWDAFAVDTALIGTWIAVTLLLMAEGLPGNLAALGGYGLAGLAVACLGLPLLGRGAAGAAKRQSARGAMRSGWHHGRWALGGAAVTALQNQAHVYLLAWLGTAAAVADLNAARMLLMPMGLLVLGVNKTLLPTLVRQHAQEGAGPMRRTANRTLMAVLATITAYVAVLLLGENTIIRWILGPKYTGIALLVTLWGAVLLLQAVDANWSVVLQAAKRFRELTLINLWTVAPVLAVAVPMILAYGARGNLLALAVGYAGMCLLLRREIGRVLPVHPPAAEGGSADPRERRST